MNEAPAISAPPLDGIAIIGLSGRFPGAPDVGTFWRNLCEGRDSIRRFTDDELRAAGADPAMLLDPAFVRARGVLEGVDQFDAAFFGMQPRDADLTDPQQRVFLECAWEAFEDAGYRPADFPGPVGVFAGASLNTYFLTQVLGPGGLLRFVQGFQVDDYPTLVGNDKDYLATRVAYRLNLRGPALTLQTACSTSLVAVCQACASLLSFQCDLALAGGVSITFPQERGYLYQEGAIASADGLCRAFDASANGTVFGAGCGVVLLKRLEDAWRDGDFIYAVIKGSAVNNDGAAKSSYSAPSIDGQAEVIALAQALAGVSSDSIGYVETHGTGTPLGDPIEVAALTRAFRGSTTRTGFCALGSVKPNVGHLEAAAGVTGLIKTALALRHRTLPATLHFRAPNPNIDFASSPFHVVDRLSAWDHSPEPRRAGVSSFGVGGTNAHVVLEEAPAPRDLSSPTRPSLLLLSARSPDSLATFSDRLATALIARPDEPRDEVFLACAAHTLQVGRTRFAHRRVTIARTCAEASEMLRNPSAGAVAPDPAPQVVFLFPGQGSQQVHVGRTLYGQEEVFTREVDSCAAAFRSHLDLDLRELLFPDAPRAEAAQARLRETSLAQPALFTIEYALARLWMSWGIRPAALIGHSIGEFVAAALAGVMRPDDAMALVAARGRLMQAAPPGAMLGVRASDSEVRPQLPEGLVIAAINSPTSTVVAGAADALTEFAAALARTGRVARLLATSHAFHSPSMDAAVAPFEALVRQRTLAAPTVPIVSTRTGTWLTEDEATSPSYWSGQIRDPVQFARALASLGDGTPRLFVEVGPGQVLTRLANSQIREFKGSTAVASLPAPEDDSHDEPAHLVSALGRLWCLGVEPDWNAYHAHATLRRVPLPPSVFQRKRHWAEPRGTAPAAAPSPASPAATAHDMPITPTSQAATSPTSLAAVEELILRQLQVMQAQLDAAAASSGPTRHD